MGYTQFQNNFEKLEFPWYVYLDFSWIYSAEMKKQMLDIVEESYGPQEHHDGSLSTTIQIVECKDKKLRI